MEIDDFKFRRILSNYLINHCYGADKKYKFMSINNKFSLLGSEYAILNKKIFQNDKNISSTKNIKQILIYFGGNDHLNLNQIAVKTCKLIFKNKIKIVIVTSQTNNNLILLKKICKIMNVKLVTNTNKFYEILTNSDIAIGASGVNSLERIALGIPSIVFSTVLNQDFQFKNIINDKLAIGINLKKNTDIFFQLKIKLKYILANYSRIKKQALLSTNKVNRKGTKKIAEIIINDII